MLLRLLLLINICCCCDAAFAQSVNTDSLFANDTNKNYYSDSNFVIIRHIIVTGNKKTQARIILRELDLHPGDTLYYKNAMQILEQKKQQVLNTSLFLTVNVFFKNWAGQYTDVAVDVTERWYAFPIPILKLADRNFNVWWVEEHHRLNRLDYGVNFFQNNLTGKNDQLILTFQSGYTHRYGITYNLPYIDKQLKNGLGFTIFFNQNREVNYVTDHNKLAFTKQENFINKQFITGLSYAYRPGIRLQHQVAVTYNFISIGDTVVKLNPDYLLDKKNKQQYLQLTYRFSYNGTDNWAYPLYGFNFIGEFSQIGFNWLGNFHTSQFNLITAKYWQIFPNTFLSAGIRGQLQLPSHQPYFLQKDMGYMEYYLRGLEYEVMDSNAFGILKTNIKQRIFNFNIHLPLVPEKFSVVPIRIFAKIYGDAGYAHSDYPGNSILNNKLLYTYGLGIDLVTFYDVRLRVEYSFNQLHQNGLFLHVKSEL